MPPPSLALVVIILVLTMGAYPNALAAVRQGNGNKWASTDGHARHRPCFICPANAVISLRSPTYGHENNVARTITTADNDDSDQHQCPLENSCALMPEPVIRPCLNHHKKYEGHESQRGNYQQKNIVSSMKTQVVRGPQPGSQLTAGIYRVVLRVTYHRQQSDNENNDTPAQQLPSRHSSSYCRYTVTVLPASNGSTTISPESEVCQPPSGPENGRVVCSSSFNRVLEEVTTSCRYLCDDGYVAPNSQRHLVRQEWPCRQPNNIPPPPQCIKAEAPIPLFESECADRNLTVGEQEELESDDQLRLIVGELSVPRFHSPAAGMVDVSCGLSEEQPLSSGDSKTIRRTCVAGNNETDARFNCSYNVVVTLDPNKPDKNEAGALMFAQLHFQISSLTQAESSLSSFLWCDDPDVADKLIRTAQTNLVQRINAESCRKANCSLLTVRCLRQNVTDHSRSSQAGGVLDVEWTVTADYASFSAEDYFYEGSEVPEGEALIEKIQAETESAIELDEELAKEIGRAGGKLVDGSFRLGHLDLICKKPGYVVDPSTNQCQKCPTNHYQAKNACQPCPEGTVQPRTGQTECIRKYPETVANTRKKAGRRPPSFPSGRPILMHRKSPGVNGAAAVFMIQPLVHHQQRHRSSGKSSSHPLAPVVRTSTPVTDSKVKKRNRLNKMHGAAVTSTSTNHLPDEEDGDNPCRPNPCQSGGTCIHLSGRKSFKCSCRPGTFGVLCESSMTGSSIQEKRDRCPPPLSTNFCMNGGTCFLDMSYRGGGSPDCFCPPGFVGARCQVRRHQQPAARALGRSFASKPIRRWEVDDDEHEPIKQKAEVSSRFDGSTTVREENTLLTSSVGESGASSTPSIGFCASNPCRNGGRCVDHSHAVPAPGYYTCICPAGFQGASCELTLCPAGMGWPTCPGRHDHAGQHPHRHHHHHHRCVIETSTGRRHCRPFHNSNNKNKLGRASSF